ncbi:hypothetical protein SAMN04487881_0722 [Marinobacter sp. es.048]|uniref:hypothetical protein n=1 Tax=Marinobacter sp. es.048 TaxID=1761795 RepID=UPI000B58F4BB|nr:hypothetical protein [Marinobacter sp. es.048]SNC62727.1 hypothetical protein SAMN04487881_0722 [Marinobacter sp. es.048]
MRLITTARSDLMEVNAVEIENGCVVITGTIMGAMPVKAVVSGAEMRKGFSLIGVRGVFKVIWAFLRGRTY